MMKEHPPLVWARLNADGMLIAFLAIISGLDLLNPLVTDIYRDFGTVPPTFYLWTLCFISGGLFMIIGFITRTIGPELFGRLLVCLGLLLELFRYTVTFGLSHPETTKLTLIAAILITVCVARAWSLLSRAPLHIIIGGRRSQ